VGSGASADAEQGYSVALSGDGDTAIVGGDTDGVGSAWVWTRNGTVWTQQGSKLVGSGAIGAPAEGSAVSLSADGATILIGGFNDESGRGAGWIFVGSPFSDDPLTPGVSVVKAAHISELRQQIDSGRLIWGLGLFSWSDPTLTVGVTAVRAQHVLELRHALADIYITAGAPSPTYTDPELTAGMIVKAVHISELRAAVMTAPRPFEYRPRKKPPSREH
jgi:hypothetical protein